MKDLPRILAADADLDAGLEQELASTGHSHQVEARQILDRQAYFSLCWGPLEVELDGRCRNAVRERRRSADWQIRRARDLCNPEDERFSGLSFEDRVRLVLDGQGGRGSPFAVTLKHDSIRHEIAHGRLRSTRIDVSAFVADCYLTQSALYRAP